MWPTQRRTGPCPQKASVSHQSGGRALSLSPSDPYCFHLSLKLCPCLWWVLGSCPLLPPATHLLPEPARWSHIHNGQTTPPDIQRHLDHNTGFYARCSDHMMPVTTRVTCADSSRVGRQGVLVYLHISAGAHFQSHLRGSEGLGGQRLRSREGGRGRELAMERLWPLRLSRSAGDSRRGEGPLGPIRLWLRRSWPHMCHRGSGHSTRNRGGCSWGLCWQLQG